MSEERRRVPRFSLHLKASVTLPGQTTPLEVKVENLCALGCLLESAPSLEPHQQCEFLMTWKGRQLKSPAFVAWKGADSQVGLEFYNTDAENQMRLRQMCSELLMEPLIRLSGQREQSA